MRIKLSDVAGLVKDQRLCLKCLQPLTDAEGKDAKYHVGCRPNKYRNVARQGRWMGASVKFDSGKEAKRAAELQILFMQGAITDLRRQVEFHLNVNGHYVGKYIADFVYTEAGAAIVEDVKSEATRRTDYYQLKRRLFEALYHPLKITEV